MGDKVKELEKKVETLTEELEGTKELLFWFIARSNTSSSWFCVDCKCMESGVCKGCGKWFCCTFTQDGNKCITCGRNKSYFQSEN
jgi:hypothetical protein